MIYLIFLTILDSYLILDTKFSYKSFLESVVNTKVMVLRTRNFQKTLTVGTNVQP